MKFKDLFHRRNTNHQQQGNGGGAPVQNVGNAQPAGNAFAAMQLERVEDNEQEQTQMPEHLSNMARALRRSEKGGLGNQDSEYYKQVDLKLGMFMEFFGRSLYGDSANAQKDVDTLIEAIKVCDELIQACESYTGRRAITQKGKDRQAIVVQILIHVREDKKNFYSYLDKFAAMPQERRAKSISEVIETGRRRKLVLNGKTEKELDHVGGAASLLTKIQKGDLTDGDVSGYFREDETMGWDSDAARVRKLYQEQKKASPISNQDARLELKNILNEAIEDSKLSAQRKIGRLKSHSQYLTNPEIYEFINAMEQKFDSQGIANGNLKSGGVMREHSEVINLSKRNVAASRLANLLGVGSLIAQSETAELQDGNRSVTGNLMQAATGVEAKGAVSTLYQEAVAKGKIAKDDSKMVNSAYMRQWFTPQFMKSLTSLQVLDNLMGQVDRHHGNFMVDVKDGKMGSVQGIDNDLAFGYSMIFGDMTGPSGHSRSMLDKNSYSEENWQEAKLSIPYMDKALAQRILAVKEEDIRIITQDLLEPKAIDGLCKRLKVMQQAITTEQKDKNSKRFLEGDDAWNNDEVFQAFEKDSQAGNQSKTYLGRYMNTRYKVDPMEEIKELALAYWNRNVEGMETANQIAEFIKSIGGNIDKNHVQFLLNTGKMTKDPGVIKTFRNSESVYKSLATKEREYRKSLNQKK